MTLATLDAAKTVQLPGITGRPLAVPSRGSSELAVWSLEVAPGAAGAPHTVDREEVFVLHAGRMTAVLTRAGHDQTYDMGPGDALIVPADTPFALRNTGEEVGRLTVCTTAGIRATLDGTTITPEWSV